MTAEVAEIVHVLKGEVARALSPWRDRNGAADYCCCGTTSIDMARGAGFIPDHGGSGMPRFKTKDLDIWIECGMPTRPDTVAMEKIKALRRKG